MEQRPYEIMNEVKATSHDIEYYNGMENFHDAGVVLEQNLKYKLRLQTFQYQWL